VVSARPAVVHPLVLDTERLAGSVGNRTIIDVELRAAALRGLVLEGEIAVESVPGAIEADGERLDDVECAIPVDCEQRIEVADANRSPLRARRLDERAERQNYDSKCAINLKSQPLPPSPKPRRTSW
jgi:hypothetical protein